MKKREVLLTLFFLVIVTTFFFNKTILFIQVPFPGDLLVSEYNPWRAYSYLGYNPGTIPSKLQYFDVIRQMYPWKTLTIERLLEREFPLWNPYNFSGSPLFANIQSAVLYPLNLLYFVLPQVWSWSILVVLQPLLAGFFTYLFAREIGIGKLGAFLSSMAFSYSLYMSVFLEYNTIIHVILWLPLLLFLIERLAKKITFLRLFFLFLSTALPFLAGHLQLAAFVFISTVIYGVFRSTKAVMGVFFILIGLGIGLSSIQLLPTLELIGLSARVPQEYEFLVNKLLIQPIQTILLLSPDFFGNPATRNYLISDTYPGNALYIGLVPLIFSIFSIRQFRENPFVRFFLISAAILLLLFIHSPISEFLYRFEIPLFSTGSPTNAIFLLSFCLALLCGFGVQHWLARKEAFYNKVTIVLIGTFLLIWVGLVTIRPEIVSAKNFIYSTIIITAFVALFAIGEFLPKRKIVIGLLFIVITVFDLFYFFQKFNPFVHQDLVFPSTSIFEWLSLNGGINRFWGYGTGAIEANFATQYKLFSPDGYDPLYPRRFGEFIQSSKEGEIITDFTSSTRSDAVITSGFGEKDLIENQYRLRVLDMLGIKYIVDRIGSGATEKTFPGDRFLLIYDSDGWRIFENKKAAPRVFLASDYKVFNSKEDFEDLFFAKDFDPSKVILLEKEVKDFNYSKNRSGVSKIVSYAPNKVVINTQTESNQLLFLSDTYYPGWKAFVEPSTGSGQVETKIYRANYAFRTVVVPKGENTIIFRYQPESFYLGAKISIISFILAILVIGVAAKRLNK